MLDALVVLGLAVVVPDAGTPRDGVGARVLTWFAGALLVGLVERLCAHRDGRRRESFWCFMSRATEGFASSLLERNLPRSWSFLIAMHRTYNAQVVGRYWKREFDGFLDFDPNPIRFGGDVFGHLTRIAAVFPGGPPFWAALAVLAATVGLVSHRVDRTTGHSWAGSWSSSHSRRSSPASSTGFRSARRSPRPETAHGSRSGWSR